MAGALRLRPAGAGGGAVAEKLMGATAAAMPEASGGVSPGLMGAPRNGPPALDAAAGGKGGGRPGRRSAVGAPLIMDSSSCGPAVYSAAISAMRRKAASRR